MATSASPTWGTIQEAADHLKVSISTIRRYVREGTIDATRVGPRLIRVDIASLDGDSLAGRRDGDL